MSHTSRLKRIPDAFRRPTGVTPEALDRLLAELEPRYQQADARRKKKPTRQREPGAGREFALPPTDRLLMLLMYYRTYATRALLGFLFGLDDSSAGRNINPLQPLLAGIFRIPGRRVELGPDEIRELLFGATGRATPRPTRGQGRFYSGEEKRHALKHQVVVVRGRKTPGRAGQRRRVRIAAVSRAFPGKTHDEEVYGRTRVVCPRGAPGTGDAAYVGTGLSAPRKKPRGGELTPRQKAGNRRVSRRRIVVERGTGKMRVWRIAAGRYRNPRRRHTLIIENVAGLHDLMYA